MQDLQLRRFPTAGHWLNQQEPERVNAALRAFLTPERERALHVGSADLSR